MLWRLSPGNKPHSPGSVLTAGKRRPETTSSHSPLNPRYANGDPELAYVTETPDSGNLVIHLHCPVGERGLVDIQQEGRFLSRLRRNHTLFQKSARYVRLALQLWHVACSLRIRL
jgi:hypothetical protein